MMHARCTASQFSDVVHKGMVLQSSGPISVSQVRREFKKNGATGVGFARGADARFPSAQPIRMSQYYGKYNMPANANVTVWLDSREATSYARGAQNWDDGLQNWYDATRGVTTDGNGRVSSWADRSGNNRAATQATTSYRPWLTPSFINGLPAIDFQGTTNVLLGAQSVSAPGVTMIFVGKATGSKLYNQFFSTAGAWATGSHGHLLRSTTYTYSFNVNATNPTWDLPSSATVNVPFMLTFSISGGVGTARVNGSSAGSFNFGSAPTSVLANIELGGWGTDATRTFVGGLGEVLVFNTVLSEGYVSLVEGYLAWKWKLNTMLPASHAYYASPPSLPIKDEWRDITRNPNAATPTWFDGLQNWYDATRGVTTDANNRVSAWTDRSGNNRGATQATSANQPWLTTGFINGLPAIDFRGTSGVLLNAQSVNAANVTLVFVGKATGYNGYNRFFSTAGTWALGVHRYMLIGAQQQFSFSINTNQGTWEAQRFDVSSTTLNKPFVVVFSYSGRTGTARVNGASAGSFDYKNSTAVTSLLSNIELGGSVAADNLGSFAGGLGEVLVFNTTLSTDRVSLIEGYLAWKWGLNGSLPAGHPYFAAAPALTASLVNVTTPWATSAPFFQFAGTSAAGQYATLPGIDGVTSFRDTDAYSMSVWVNLPTLNQPHTADLTNEVVSKWNSYSTGYPCSLTLWGTALGPYQKGNVVTATYWYKDSSNNVSRFVQRALTPNVWTNITMSYDWKSTPKRLDMYVDGMLLASNTWATAVDTVALGNSYNTSNVSLMARRVNGVGSNWTKGNLAMFCMFDKALTQAEATALYGSTAGNFATELFGFTIHTFTNASATGRFGPTLAQCRTAYTDPAWTADDRFLHVSTQGLQRWKVPRTGMYMITCAGAQGGHFYARGTTDKVGGRGRVVKTASVPLTVGQIVTVMVGQAGINSPTSAGVAGGAGGGGASFVVIDDDPFAPIIVAGGGGGPGDQSNGDDAVYTPAGGGGGGTSTFTVSNGGASGGGGIYGNGAGILVTGGLAFANGGTGGIASGGDATMHGGFGGGGGGAGVYGWPGGAGGGYTGGNASPTYGGGGGGGTSYCVQSGLDLGFNGSTSMSIDPFHGYVAIERSTVLIEFGLFDAMSAASKTACRGAYSCRLLTAGYADPVLRIRRGSDNALANVMSDSNGILTVNGASFASWLGTTATAFVDTWYDQSGKGNHCTQPTTTRQPTFVERSRHVNFGGQTDAFLNMPSGTVPLGASSYGFVVRHARFLGAKDAPAPMIVAGAQSVGNDSSLIAWGNIAYKDNWYNGMDYTFGSAPVDETTVAVTYDGYAKRAYINGAAQIPKQASGRNTTSGQQYLGGMWGPNYFRSPMYHVLIFDAAPSDADLVALGAFDG